MSSIIGTDSSAEIAASELIADVSRLVRGPGDESRLTQVPLQDGVELLLWRGHFEQPLETCLRDDSDRVHFTYVLEGKAACEVRRHCRCQFWEAGAAAGIIHFGPERRGRFRQQGSYASVSVMMRPDVFAAWGDAADPELRRSVRDGWCFAGDCRGAELHATAQLLCRALPEASERNRMWLKGQGLALCGLLLESRSAPTQRVGTADRAKLLRARDLLLADLSLAPTLTELAAYSGLSLLKLKRGFRALFGNSVYGLFMQERMHEARRRLLSGAGSVTEVATDLGYANVSHFAAAFRKRFGVNPASLK